MKNFLEFGTLLTREETKQITGGRFCPDCGEAGGCSCGGGTWWCDFKDGTSVRTYCRTDADCEAAYEPGAKCRHVHY